MDKTKKKSLIIIAIVVILFIIVCLVYEEMKTEPVDANITNTSLVDENTGLDNIINELFEDVTTNEEVENEVEEENIQKEDTNTNAENKGDENELEDKEEDVSSTESVTSKQEKAINLVKKEWGGDDGVYFSNESIDSQGRYIVSVRDKGTTNSLAFFLVDVDKELVTKQ